MFGAAMASVEIAARHAASSSTRRLMSIRWSEIQSPEQSVVVAIFLERDRLEKDVRKIDVGVAVHDLDNAARSIFRKDWPTLR
jgi:hypothetical protein